MQAGRQANKEARRKAGMQAGKKAGMQASTRKAFSRSHALEGLVAFKSIDMFLGYKNFNLI